jgi:hypothetical protein
MEGRRLTKTVLALLPIILFFNTGIALGAEWLKTYGRVPVQSFGFSGSEIASAVQQTSDGGYIVAGIIPDSLPISKHVTSGWIFKLNSDGEMEWQKVFYGGDHQPTSIQQTSDSGYIVAGYTGTFGYNTNSWIAKLSDKGEVQWNKVYGSGGSVNYPYPSKANSIQQTADGGYIVAGHMFRGAETGNTDYWVLKLDAGGEIQWQKAYGGPSNDEAYSVQELSDGNYIVMGTSDSFGSGNRGIWVLKLDGNGETLWQIAYQTEGNSYGHSVQRTSDDGYILLGSTDLFRPLEPTSVWGDILVIKLNGLGEIQWQKAFANDLLPLTEASSIQQTSDGGYIVAASGWILKLNQAGEVQWQKTYDGIYLIASAQQTYEGGYILAGTTDLFSSFGVDITLLKLDSLGNIPNCPVAVEAQVSTKDIGVTASITNGKTSDADGSSRIDSGTTSEVAVIVSQMCNTTLETISPPDAPGGPTTGKWRMSYLYSVEGAASNLGHPVQYCFWWGDGTNTGWLPAGTTSATKIWSEPGTYTVRARARCSIDHTVISGESLTVTVQIIAPIRLKYPNNERFNTCSLYAQPPLFSWEVAEDFTAFDILFSGNASIPDALSFTVPGTETQLAISLESWRQISSLPQASIGTVLWKVVGKKGNGTTETDVGSIIFGAEPAGDPGISPTGRRSKPTLSWQTNCDTKFKVWFGSDSGFTKRTYSFEVGNLTGAEGTFSKTLTPLQWMRIKLLAKNKSGSTIYWYIESWDALMRYAKTEVMSFVLTE